MSSTPALPTIDLAVDPGPWDAVGEGWMPSPDEAARLGGEEVLEALGEQRAMQRMLETSRLVLAVRLATTYERLPAVAPTGEGHHTRRLALAGAGAPLVHEHAPLELASALGVGPDAGRTLMGAALEVHHRLPRLWARLVDGEIDAWRAREVARETLSLAAEVAAMVDELLAETPRAINQVTAADLVQEALLALDPDEAARREARHGDGRAVVVTPPDGPRAAPGLPGRWGELHARMDAPDLAALDATVDRLARILGHDDPAPHQQLRSTALGLLADPHAAAALLDTGLVADVPRRPATLYVHVGVHDLATLASGTDHGARVERYGPATLALVERWLDRRDVRLTPVIDQTADEAVDGHDPPTRIREQVVLRQRSCVVPGCRRPARACDLDHVDPYVDPDDGGPPGQTRPSNLQPLCRSHHRMKTHAPARFALLVRELPEGRLRPRREGRRDVSSPAERAPCGRTPSGNLTRS